VNSILKKQFEVESQKDGFSVCFSREVARVVEYQEGDIKIHFTLDMSENGDDRVTLEHHPKSWARNSKYEIAFSRTQKFLESCNFKIEVYGEN